MQQWVLDWIGAFGGLAIWWLIFLENLFPHIPSEVILTFSGFLTVQSNLTLSTAAVAATIGSVTGALALYAVGHALGQQRLMRWLDGRAGRILRLSSADVEKAQRWFDRHGGGAVFFCRFVPLVRSLISIPAGIAHMPLLRFTLLTTIGSAIWNVVLIWLGACFGDAWERVVCYMDTYAWVALGTLGAAALIGILIHRHRARP